MRIDNAIDEVLDMKFSDIEAQVLNNQKFSDSDLYIGELPAIALNTSWIDLYNILNKASSNNPRAVICDLGAGSCRLSLIAYYFFPKIKVISIEPVAQRMKRAIELQQDSHNIFIDAYFKDYPSELEFDYVLLYFPNGPAFESVLDKMKKIRFQFSILCIESHGEMINRLTIEQSWLKAESSLRLIAPRHNQDLIEFKKIEGKKSQLEHKLAEIFKHSGEFKIRDTHGEWLASSKGLKIFYDKKLQVSLEFSLPSRTIYLNENNLIDIMPINQSDIPNEIIPALSLRGAKQPYRKVYLDGTIELSNGSFVHLDQL